MEYLAIIQSRRRKNLAILLSRYPTQREFADLVGLSTAQVSHIVNGVREMGEEIARRIEQSLRLGIGWMDREDPEDALDMLDPREKIFILNLRGLTKEQQDKEMKDIEVTKRQNEEIYETIARQRRTV